MKNDQIDISIFLKICELSRDVVVKASPSLPHIHRGGDVDIFSLDPESLVAELSSASKSCGFRFVRSDLKGHQIHLDAIEGGSLLFRLDIYSRESHWTNIPLKASFLDFAVKSAITAEFGSARAVPVLDRPVEAMVRYVEYVSHFQVGRDKVHHVDWIQKSLTREEWSRALELSHYFLEGATNQEANRESKSVRWKIIELAKRMLS